VIPGGIVFHTLYLNVCSGGRLPPVAVLEKQIYRKKPSPQTKSSPRAGRGSCRRDLPN